MSPPQTIVMPHDPILGHAGRRPALALILNCTIYQYGSFTKHENVSTDSYKRLFRPISIERKVPKMIKIKRNSELCYLHQVRCSDKAVPLLVEHSKSFHDLVLNVGIFELPGHNVHS